MLSKKSANILRIGLALVFLSNALGGWFAPQEFQEIIGNSFLVHLFPTISVSVFLMIIRINDSLLFLIFLFNYKKVMRAALIWASIWIIIVILVILDPLDCLEHLGFLAMAVALLVNR